MIHKFDEKPIYKLENLQRRLEKLPLKIFDPLDSSKVNTSPDGWRGIGYFLVSTAGMAGGNPVIYALDISPEMLDGEGENAFEIGLSNIRVIRTEEYEQEPKDFSVDFINISNVAHVMKDKDRMINEITRMLKSGGRFSMIEWEKKQGSYGPPLEDRISYEEAADLLTQKGYSDISKHIISENFYGVKARKL